MGRFSAPARIAVIAVAALFVAGNLWAQHTNGSLAYDFKLRSADRLLHSLTIYPTNGPDAGGYPYPPLWATLAAPLTFAPYAQYLAAIVCLAAILAALWIVGLRDPHCFALAACSQPVLATVDLGNPTAIIVFLSALTYRYSGAAGGVAITIKPYAWPLLVWSATTRGMRDLAVGIGAASAGMLVPWALIGFDGIGRYPQIVNSIADATRGHTLALPTEIAVAVSAMAAVAMWLTRRDPIRSFSWATALMLAATPILWPLYLTSALLPLALARPRFSVIWLMLPATWWLHGTPKIIAAFAVLAYCGLRRHEYHTLHSPRPPAPPFPAPVLPVPPPPPPQPGAPPAPPAPPAPESWAAPPPPA